ncbi:MAG: GAF domain-containing protein [Bacteroidia bacterium]|nr:GAF domain-containing protein [Bacteroidia bacterium]MBP7436639.1 GAF domain-containing protein [Bacteroidia bacterium]MBP7728211.1 GAF domain-containing protein [Bacteroidia bacterium]MBP7771392.1 GAF domain-containing protein [Bacteroidia bacterium]
MAESITLPESATRAERYELLLPQLQALLDRGAGPVANMANVSAALREAFGFFWVGFYLVDPANERLVLGPFQGPVACTTIANGKGVCGTAWAESRVILVPDVDRFPGHIACSSDSRSEIVLPIRKQGAIVGVLDVDSDKLNDFSEVDAHGLSRVLALLEECL